MAVEIIAEAGSCHDGHFSRAMDLIGVAKGAGVDVIKFQFWSSAERLAARRNAPAYREIYEQYRVPASWLPQLQALATSVGLEFMCTTYLPEDIDVVAPYVRRFKVASFEANDAAFLHDHLGYGKPILVSTGMDAKPQLPQATWLHCVSAYPTPFDQANLNVLRQGFAGFSDHTACIYTGAFATCVGATILEVHMRDWPTAKDNPDFTTALDPGQLAEYVRLVRLAERMLGDGKKRLMPAEAAMAQYQVAGA